MRQSGVLIIFILMLCTLSGCYDKIELENRAFAASLGIDLPEDKDKRYSISMSFPDVSALATQSGDDEKKTIKKANGKTISEAIHEIDSLSSRYTDLGNMKLCVISEDVLSDENLLRETVDTLERNTDISKRIILMSTDKKAAEILEAKIQGEPLVGMFVDRYFKNNESVLKGDLESVVGDLCFSETVLLPRITLEEEEIKIGGAAVIKDCKLVGVIEEKDLHGYLWINENASQISADHNGIKTPLKVIDIYVKQGLSWENDRLVCRYDIKVNGYIEEYKFSDDTLFDNAVFSHLSEAYSEAIRDEVMKTWRIFYQEFKADGFNVKENLRKKEYGLYKTLEDDLDEVLANMDLQVKVDVNIKNTGIVK